MEKIFYNYLNPRGSTYAKQIATYKQLKDMVKDEIADWLEENMTGKQIRLLLAEYMVSELTYKKEEDTPKVRITQEQFDEFFRIIKPQDNPARLRRQMMEETQKAIDEGTK